MVNGASPASLCLSCAGQAQDRPDEVRAPGLSRPTAWRNDIRFAGVAEGTGVESLADLRPATGSAEKSAFAGLLAFLDEHVRRRPAFRRLSIRSATAPGLPEGGSEGRLPFYRTNWAWAALCSSGRHSILVKGLPVVHVQEPHTQTTLRGQRNGAAKQPWQRTGLAWREIWQGKLTTVRGLQYRRNALVVFAGLSPVKRLKLSPEISHRPTLCEMSQVLTW
jgi:hypothetical protein